MHSKHVYWSSVLCVLLGACTGLDSQPEDTENVSVDDGTPTKFVLRQLPDKNSHARLDRATPVERIVVKFHEGTHVRLRGEALRAEFESRSPRDRRTLQKLGISDERVLEDVTQANELLRGGLRPTFSQDEKALESAQQVGEAAAKRELAPLSGIS